MREGGARCNEGGFTLVELLIALVISLVLLAGLYSNFIMQSRVQKAQSSVVARAEDLRIAAQVMQNEMRLAQAICWDATNKRLIYQPADSATALGACTAVAAANGAFAFRAADAAHPSPYICWDMPNNAGGCQELVRGLKSNTGLQVSPTTNSAADLVGRRSVTLTAVYVNAQQVQKDWSIRFDVLPRNSP